MLIAPKILLPFVNYLRMWIFFYTIIKVSNIIKEFLFETRMKRLLTSQNFCWIQPQWQKWLCNLPLSVLWFHWVFYGGPNFSNMFDPVHFWPSLILSDLVWSGLILSDPVRFWPTNHGISGPNLWDPRKHREPQNLTIPLFSSLDHPEILIIIINLNLLV